MARRRRSAAAASTSPAASARCACSNSHAISGLRQPWADAVSVAAAFAPTATLLIAAPMEQAVSHYAHNAMLAGLDGVEVISDNPRYEPEVLEGQTLEQFAILGRALGGFNIY